MENIFQEIMSEYLEQKNKPFKENPLAIKLRNDFPRIISECIPNKNLRYTVEGSAGQGQWTDCPWLAILDILITKSPQSGYYPVFLFKADMSGVYLSLNQGVTDVNENYKNNGKNVLRTRAKDFRAKINITKDDLIDIDLKSNVRNARLYEAGNIIARYYSANSNFQTIKKDLHYYLRVYAELGFNDTQFIEIPQLNVTERKKIRWHLKIERNTELSEKVKKAKGYICEVCNFNFEQKYGILGKAFIEAHHLQPVSELEIGNTNLNIETDFAVLCSNCHSMIHRLNDSSDLLFLKEIIKLTNFT